MAIEQKQNTNLLETLNQLEEQLDNGPQPKQPEINLGEKPQATVEQSTEQAVDAAIDQHLDQAIDQTLEQTSPLEQALEQYVETDDENPDSSPYVIKKARPQDDTAKDDHVGKSDQLVKIEELMAEGLAEAYHSMTPEQQQKFREKGEETAKEIVNLMDKLKLTAKKALSLIRGWLKIIPGVNKYFLEQEAKIKTEEIMRYAEERAVQQPPS